MDTGRVLADTSLFIQYMRAKDKARTVLHRLAREVDVETSAVVAAEIFFGARTPDAEAFARSVLEFFPIHPFTARMAERQTLVLPDLTRRNRVPDMRDLMIAVSALELDIPLATLNRRHFEAIPGLHLVDL